LRKQWGASGERWKGKALSPPPSLPSLHPAYTTQDSYFGHMKKYHLKHHFAGLQNHGYGITSKVWDLVFGTELKLGAAAAAAPVAATGDSDALLGHGSASSVASMKGQKSH
jgi:hypothetical protein